MNLQTEVTTGRLKAKISKIVPIRLRGEFQLIGDDMPTIRFSFWLWRGRTFGKRTPPGIELELDKRVEEWGEPYTSGVGQKMRVHRREDCIGEHCVIHNPSNHPMLSFPTLWRSDRSLMERICPHGVGHPDPDDLSAKQLMMGPEYEFFAFDAHGCDGCCA